LPTTRTVYWLESCGNDHQEGVFKLSHFRENSPYVAWERQRQRERIEKLEALWIEKLSCARSVPLYNRF
jgi:hypothetical protein